MHELFLKAMFAGIFFGIWPLLMNKSGMTGNVATALFTLVCCVIVVPFALNGFEDMAMQNARWSFVVGAAVFGAIGLLLFNGMLAKATSQNVATLFVIMIVAQIMVPTLYQILVGGGVTVSKGFGLIFAVIAALLLI